MEHNLWMYSTNWTGPLLCVSDQVPPALRCMANARNSYSTYRPKIWSRFTMPFSGWHTWLCHKIKTRCSLKGERTEQRGKPVWFRLRFGSLCPPLIQRTRNPLWFALDILLRGPVKARKTRRPQHPLIKSSKCKFVFSEVYSGRQRFSCATLVQQRSSPHFSSINSRYFWRAKQV